MSDIGEGQVGIRNVSEEQINPATSENQDAIITNTTVGTLSPENSSSTPLGIGGVFTGTAIDVTQYASVIVAVKSDVVSATDGLSIQFSVDGTNWDHVDPHTISANTSHSLTVAPQAQYFRVVYTNGGTGQTYFRLQSLLRRSAVGPQMETLSGDVSDTNFASTTRAVLAAKKPNGAYTNIQATAGGNLKVSIEEMEAGAGLATEAKQDSIVSAIQAIPSGGDATPYDTLIEDASATITYIGKAVAGTAVGTASWQIKRIDSSSGTAIRFADGVSTFTKVWNSRATYTY